MLLLDIFENHEGHSRYLLPRHLLQNLAHASYNTHPRHRNELFDCLVDEGKHPNAEKGIVDQLDVISAFG